MNFCCEQQPCLSLSQSFHDLTKEIVLDVAGILNYCDHFHTLPDHTHPSLFRNQAYRFLVLWQCGKMGPRQRVCPPSCCVARIRYLYPSVDGTYTGYQSGDELGLGE